MSPTPEIEVDMERKEELVLAKMLRACSVNIRPKPFTMDIEDPPLLRTNTPLTSSVSDDHIPLSISEPDTQTSVSRPTRPISAIGLHYWSQCTGVSTAPHIQDKETDETKSHSPLPWVIQSQEEVENSFSVSNVTGNEDTSRTNKVEVTDWAAILANKDGNIDKKILKSSAEVTRFPKPWVFDGPDPTTSKRRSYVLEDIQETKDFKDKHENVTETKSMETMCPDNDCKNETSTSSFVDCQNIATHISDRESSQRNMVDDTNYQDVNSHILNLFRGIPVTEQASVVTHLISFLDTEQLLEVVSTILSKKNLCSVILQSMDSESRSNLISQFVHTDQDMEILLRKESVIEGESTHNSTQGSCYQECEDSEKLCKQECGLASEKSPEKEPSQNSEESCDKENVQVSEKSSEEDYNQVHKESCQQECAPVSEESIDEKYVQVSVESCQEEHDQVSEDLYEEEHTQVSEKSCKAEHTQVTEEPFEEKLTQVILESCEEKHTHIFDEYCQEKHAQINDESCEKECDKLSKESCEAEFIQMCKESCDAEQGLISKEAEDNKDAAKHNCNNSRYSSPILNQNQETKDLSCDYNVSEEDFMDGTGNVEIETGKEDVKEVHSNSDTKTFTENISTTDISETEVYEDEEADWGSDWDDEDGNEYEADDKVNNKGEMLERNDYKVQTFSGSFSISVNGK